MGAESVRCVVVLDALLVGLQAPGVDEHVAVGPQEIRGGQANVHAGRGAHRRGRRGEGIVAGGRPGRIPSSEDRADVRLFEKVLPHAPDKHVAVEDAGNLAGPHVQDADLGATGPAGELEAVVDGHLLPAQQPDSAAEEGEDLGPSAGNAPGLIDAGRGEIEHAGVLQEEGPFLGEEDRKPGQVDLAIIDFGLAEVSVDRGRQAQARRQIVEQVQPRLAPDDIVAVDAGMEPALCDERADVEADALLDVFQVGDFSCFRDLEELRLEACSGPAHLFQLALDDAADVEAPDCLPGREAEALERDRELGAPALGGASGLDDPDRVPVFVGLAVREDQAIDQRAVGIGGEMERVALVAECV